VIIPGLDLQYTADWIMSTWKTEKQRRLLMETSVWRECFLVAKSKFGADPLPGVSGDDLSSRFIPNSENGVDTVAAQLVRLTMPNDSFFMAMNMHPSETNNGASAVTSLLRYYHRRNKFRQNSLQVVKQAAICGNSAWVLDWTTEAGMVPDVMKMKMMYDQQQATAALTGAKPKPMPALPPMKRVVNYQGPTMQPVNIFDMVVQTDRPYESAARLMKFRRNDAYLKELSKEDDFGYARYTIPKNTEPSLDPDASDSIRIELNQASGLSMLPMGTGTNQMNELIQVMGDVPVKFKDGTEVTIPCCVVTLANGKDIIRLEVMPTSSSRIPSGIYQWNPRPNDPYGSGVLERNLGIQDAINTRMNQSILANGMAINPMVFYKPDGLFDPSEFTAFPGAAFPYMTTKPEPFVIPDQAMLGFNEVKLLEGMFSDGIGALINNSQGDQSATEATIVAGLGQSRFGLIAENFESSFLEEVITQELLMAQMFMTKEEQIRVVDPTDPSALPSVMPIDQKVIQGEYQIYIAGMLDMAQNQSKMGELISLTQALGQIPPLQQPGVMNWVSYAAMILRMKGFGEYISSIFPPQPLGGMNGQSPEQQGMTGAGGPQATGGTPGPSGLASGPGMVGGGRSLGEGPGANDPGGRPPMAVQAGLG
jgi:hypothetical protein